MNSVVRQLLEQNTDVVMVDTGDSYEGICGYFGGYSNIPYVLHSYRSMGVDGSLPESVFPDATAPEWNPHSRVSLTDRTTGNVYS